MPQSISDFRKISGIGEAKSKNYGEEILVLLHQTPASEGVRGKDVKAVSGATHESISRTEDTNTAGTENTLGTFISMLLTIILFIIPQHVRWCATWMMS